MRLRLEPPVIAGAGVASAVTKIFVITMRAVLQPFISCIHTMQRAPRGRKYSCIHENSSTGMWLGRPPCHHDRDGNVSKDPGTNRPSAPSPQQRDVGPCSICKANLCIRSPCCCSARPPAPSLLRLPLLPPRFVAAAAPLQSVAASCRSHIFLIWSCSPPIILSLGSFCSPPCIHHPVSMDLDQPAPRFPHHLQFSSFVHYTYFRCMAMVSASGTRAPSLDDCSRYRQVTCSPRHASSPPTRGGLDWSNTTLPGRISCASRLVDVLRPPVSSPTEEFQPVRGGAHPCG